MADSHVKRGQLDALWAYVQNKGEKGYIETETSGQFWRSTYLDMDSRLRVARGIAKDETQASIEVFRTLQRRGHPNAPPPTISDGWGGVGQAILEVYGVVPEYQGGGGLRRARSRGATGSMSRPSVRKMSKADVWAFIQVVFGSRREALELLGRSTVYVERSHLTSRLFNGRQVRKTLAFSKALGMYRAAAIIDLTKIPSTLKAEEVYRRVPKLLVRFLAADLIAGKDEPDHPGPSGGAGTPATRPGDQRSRPDRPGGIPLRAPVGPRREVESG